MILLHLYEILEKATLMYSDRKQVSGVHDQDLGKGLLQRETMEFFVSNAPYLNVDVVTWEYTFVKFITL